jgi:hypothetical protein
MTYEKKEKNKIKLLLIKNCEDKKWYDILIKWSKNWYTLKEQVILKELKKWYNEKIWVKKVTKKKKYRPMKMRKND